MSNDRTVTLPGAGAKAEADATEQGSAGAGDRYELVAERGRGGLGRVFAARDGKLERTVAVKELLSRTPETRARFEREARLAARLQHPNIVPVYDVGERVGAPYYAMKLVDGRSLADVVAGCETADERVALLPHVIAVAEAIAYAHRERIVHRDLKPANVVVGEFGETIVVDWGLAKDLGAGDDDAAPAAGPFRTRDATATAAGDILGTPAYMPPEQARGEAVDERADIYAIGAMLYHVLAGRPPYADTGDSDAVLAAVLGGPPAPLTSGPPDLVAIADKAMARDPAARYATAAALAADLNRFATGQLVSAHEYSLSALVRRWIARHRAAVAVGTVAVIAIAIGATVSIRNIVAAEQKARTNEVIALDRAAEIERRRDELILEQAEGALATDPTEALAWIATYPETGADWARGRTIAADAVSRGVARHVLRHDEEVKAVAATPDGTRFATGSAGGVRVYDARTGALIGRHAHPEVERVAIAPDGRAVAFIDYRGAAALWDVGAGTRVLDGHADPVTTVAFVDDDTLATADAGGHMRRWDRATAAGTDLGRADDAIVQLAAFPNRRAVASIARSGQVSVWDLDTGSHATLATMGGEGEAIAVDPTGQRVAAAAGGHVLIAETSGRVLARGGHDAGVVALAWLGDGSGVVSAGADRTAAVWAIGREPVWLRGHEADILALAVREREIATADAAGVLRWWRELDSDGEYEARVLRGHSQAIEGLAFVVDGAVVTAGFDEVARVWWPPEVEARVYRGADTDLFQVEWAQGGRSLVTTSRDGRVLLWDAATGDVFELGRHAGPSYALAVTPDGARAVTGGWAGDVWAWDLAARTGRRLRAGGGAVWSVVAAPDGAWVAVHGEDGGALFAVGEPWDELPMPGAHAPRYVAAFSPDGTRLVVAGDAPTVEVWSVPDWQLVATLRGYEVRPTCPAFLADGSLVTGDLAGGVWTWAEGSETGRRRGGHTRWVRSLEVAPRGDAFATSSRDHTVRLWRAGGDESTVLVGHAAEVRDLSFAPTADRLASAGWDGALLLWRVDARSGSPLRGHRGLVQRVAFSPDGTQLASVGADGTLRLWRASSGDVVPIASNAIHSWIAKTTSFRLTTGAD